MGSSKISQSIILWKAQHKDPESFAKVYDMYVDRIFRFIYFKVSDRELAQDFAAETFLKAWEYINTEKKIDNLNALLYRIARNLVIDHYRRKSTQEISLDQTMIELELAGGDIASATDIAQEVGYKLEVEQLLEVLRELKDEYEEVLLLRYVEGFDISEIAHISQKKQGAVRVLLYRAHKALEKLLREKE